MYLINARALVKERKFELAFFHNEQAVDYAILSHRWEQDEILYQTLHKRPTIERLERKGGFKKIFWCCKQALKDGLQYAWVDTCCIDRSSSSELQEAINSMYRWYTTAKACYVYLSDVSVGLGMENFRRSEWFRRGWTLQELLAPDDVKFYDQSGKYIGTRQQLSDDIHLITTIPLEYLERGFRHVERPFASYIMSWAKGRHTTRIEDRAYSLLGLFGVYMTMLYGEGENAFKRLQEEIIRTTADRSLFAWDSQESQYPGCFAQRPEDYNVDLPARCSSRVLLGRVGRRARHSVNNQGIELEVRLIPWTSNIFLAELDQYQLSGDVYKIVFYGIFLQCLDDSDHWVRARCKGRTVRIWYEDQPVYGLKDPRSDSTQLTIVNPDADESSDTGHENERWFSFSLRMPKDPVTPDEDMDRHINAFNAIYDTDHQRFEMKPGRNGFATALDYFYRWKGQIAKLEVKIGFINFCPYFMFSTGNCSHMIHNTYTETRAWKTILSDAYQERNSSMPLYYIDGNSTTAKLSIKLDQASDYDGVKIGKIIPLSEKTVMVRLPTPTQSSRRYYTPQTNCTIFVRLEDPEPVIGFEVMSTIYSLLSQDPPNCRFVIRPYFTKGSASEFSLCLAENRMPEQVVDWQIDKFA